MKLLFDNLNNIIELYSSNYSYNEIIDKLNLHIDELKLKRWIKKYKHLYKLNINSREDIKNYIIEHYNGKKFNTNGLLNNLYIIDKIDNINFKCNEKLLIQEKVYLMLNDLNYPNILCNNCKIKKPKFLSISEGYKTYCSYKCSNSHNEKIDKYRNHMIKKYGVDNSFKVKNIKDKIRKTKLKKYGNLNNIEKSIKTRLQLNGVMYINQNHIDNYSEWIDDNKFIEVYNRLDYIEDIAKYFNITLTPIHIRARKLNLLYKSRRKDVTIKKIGETIESFGYNVEYNNRTIIKPLEIDIVIRKDNSIVKTLEYNGLLYHSIGISNISKFNNWDKYKDNLSSFINKDKIKLDMCKKLNIELLILREDIYLNNPSIIDMWLNDKLKYKILDKPVIYRFKNVNKLEITSIDNIEDSIENGYRIYLDWIEVEL